MIHTVVDAVLSPGGIAALLLFALASLLGPSAVRRRRVALAAYHAFNIVEDLAAECRESGKDFPYLTKAHAGLAFANEWMVANGWRPLKPGEEGRAQLAFKSLHGEQKASQPRGAAGLLVALLLAFPVALTLTGCNISRHLHPAPPATQGLPACEAWRAAEVAWSALDIYMRQTLAQERAYTCTQPPLAPPAQQQ
jgi:hypothetical protein